MKKIFILCMALMSNIFVAAQVQIIQSSIVDADTKQPIPYVNVWIIDTYYGATADTAGMFSIKIHNPISNGVLRISAVGYYDTLIAVTQVSPQIQLHQRSYVLQAITIHPRKEKNEWLHPVDYVRRHSMFANDTIPKMLATLFPYSDNYVATPFLSKIKVYTKVITKSCIFNVRLYNYDSLTNVPDKELINKNIIVEAKNSNLFADQLEIDLSAYNIEFPKTGLFVVLEWLAIPRNEYHYSVRERSYVSYQPSFALTSDTTDVRAGCWLYIQGKWYKPDYWNFYTLPDFIHPLAIKSPAVSVLLSN